MKAILVAFLCILCGPPFAADTPAVEPFKAGDTICFVGDSITRGGWFHSFVFQFYATRFPGVKLRTFNCGKSGDNATGTLERLPGDCLQHKPNVAVVMLGMNDAAVGQPQDRPIANLEKLVVALRQAGCRVIQIGPTIYDETVDIPAKSNKGKNAALADYSQRVREMAARLGNGFVDFNAPMQRLNTAGQKVDAKFTLVGPDRVHPGEVGHLVMAYEFLKAQRMPGDVARITLDAAAGRAVEQGNCKVESVKATTNGLSFTCTENALPFVPTEKSRPALDLVPFDGELNREMLVVRNLAAGTYELHLDGQPVGDFPAADLAQGVNLAANPKTPQYQQSLKITKANQRRHDIESVSMRGVALVHGALRKAKIDLNDKATAEKFLNDFIAAHKDETGNFGKTMYERYLGSWGKDEQKNLALIESLTATIEMDAAPVARKWELLRKSSP